MKTIDPNLKTHIESEITTLVTCWKVTRPDLVVMGFTEHTRDLIINSTTYKAATGLTATAIQNSSQFSGDNIEVSGILSDQSIKERDLQTGVYDFSKIEIFVVNYNDLTQGKLILFNGWIGDVEALLDQFKADLLSLGQPLQQTIGQLWSQGCRANLGDAECTVILSSFTDTGQVSQVTDRRIFQTNLTKADGIYDYGILTWTSGPNNGRQMEVKSYLQTNGKVTLFLPMDDMVSVGETFSINEGCDKTLNICISKFNNVVNFRGEPFMPNQDEALETPDAKTEE